MPTQACDRGVRSLYGGDFERMPSRARQEPGEPDHTAGDYDPGEDALGRSLRRR